MNTILRHLRGNVVAYLALLIALGGTSYAAVQLPKNSVGAKQIKTSAVRSAEIKNGAVTAADLKAGVATPKQPFVSVRAGAAVSVPQNTEYQVPWDVEVEDSFGMHDPAQPTRLVAPVAGVYRVTTTVTWNSDADGYRYTELMLNGVNNNAVAVSFTAPVVGSFTIINLSGEVRLSAGQFVTVRASQYNSGGNLPLGGSPTTPTTFATMSFVSP